MRKQHVIMKKKDTFKISLDVLFVKSGNYEELKYNTFPVSYSILHNVPTSMCVYL